MLALKALLLAAVAAPALADSTTPLGAERVKGADVEHFLEAELSLEAASGEKLRGLEEGLRKTFNALPKNAFGNLEPQAARYILHRFFVQRHGWYIRGLEGGNQTIGVSGVVESGNKEWVPAYLLDLLHERTRGQGTSLTDLVVMAAVLEDLVDAEARLRMETAFEIHELPLEGALTKEQVAEVVDTYYVLFLNSGHFAVSTRDEAIAKRKVWMTKYALFDQLDAWMKTLLKGQMDQPDLDFDKVAGMVEDIGNNYYQFNDLDCKHLKTTLSEMEGNKAGRVRLSTFYKKGRFSNWRFTEKADFLRAVGALDDSDPESPQVIVTNYVLSRPNCLEASNLYAICCRNECEDLMGHLEEHIGAPAAEPRQIAELVAALPSDSVEAPRALPEGLLQKLDQVAALNGGQVPLHGRLFAQWMHHAYPSECPYPHEEGTTSPQSPDEWMAQTGQDDTSASEEDMASAIEADTCALEPTGPRGCGGTDLPWSEKEELLVSTSSIGTDAASSSLEWWRLRDLAIASCLVASLALERAALAFARRSPAKRNDDLAASDDCAAQGGRRCWDVTGRLMVRGGGGSGGHGARQAAAFLAATFVAHAGGWLDTTAFALAVVGGVGAVAARYFAGRDRRRSGKSAASDLDALDTKCCV